MDVDREIDRQAWTPRQRDWPGSGVPTSRDLEGMIY